MLERGRQGRADRVAQPLLEFVLERDARVGDGAVDELMETDLPLHAPAEAPVDVERVKDIRQAIETGNYPLVPAKIADAMIAAGMLLRTAS